MVARNIAVFFLIPFKQREIRYPEHIELRLINEVKPLGNLNAQRAERSVHHLVFRIRNEEQNVPLLRARGFLNIRNLRLG